jgi:hypothetical protein
MRICHQQGPWCRERDDVAPTQGGACTEADHFLEARSRPKEKTGRWSTTGAHVRAAVQPPAAIRAMPSGHTGENVSPTPARNEAPPPIWRPCRICTQRRYRRIRSHPGPNARAPGEYCVSVSQVRSAIFSLLRGGGDGLIGSAWGSQQLARLPGSRWVAERLLRVRQEARASATFQTRKGPSPFVPALPGQGVCRFRYQASSSGGDFCNSGVMVARCPF